MTWRALWILIAAVAILGCGEEPSRDGPRKQDTPEIRETERSVRDGVSDEQLRYMEEFAAAYAGDEEFETCFAERVEGMEPVPRNEWPQLAGGMAAECAGTAPEPGPIE